MAWGAGHGPRNVTTSYAMLYTACISIYIYTASLKEAFLPLDALWSPSRDVSDACALGAGAMSSLVVFHAVALLLT